MKHNENIKDTVFKLSSTLSICTILITCLSCEDFVQIGAPKNQLVSSSVFSNDASAVSAISGIYNEMMSTTGFASGGSSSITVLSGLSADEFVGHSLNNQLFYENSLTPITADVNSALWTLGYKYIYYSNAVLNGLQNSLSLTEGNKMQLEGEAKFIRAFSYFYLVNLFGDVPLILTTDYKSNNSSKRLESKLVYDQIIKDLNDAKALLTDDYELFNGNRVRPNKYAASALLARVHLYLQSWIDAENEASIVINHTDLYSLNTDLQKVFLANSTESIWQLMPVNQGYNTWEAATFILTDNPRFVSLSDHLLNAFEVNDNRKIEWIGSISVGDNIFYYPYKYRVNYGATSVTEYSTVLRLAEQYMIRSEARAQQGRLEEATEDLDKIRERAGLPSLSNNTPPLDKEALLRAIENERRVELFAEWGHRWFDLKRTDRANTVFEQIKPDWQSTDILYPIPQSERNNNPNLSQNLGY